MVSKELLDYAIKGIQKGMSLSEIKSKLLSHGWGEAEISEAIGLASNPSLGKPSIDNSLINYIRSAMQKNISVSEIKEKLLSKGWGITEVDEAINSIRRDTAQIKIEKPMIFQKQEKIRRYNMKIILLIILLILLIAAAVLLVIFKGKSSNTTNTNKNVGVTINQSANSAASAAPVSTASGGSIRDCGANINCFIDASNTCKPAKVKYNYKTESSGVEKTGAYYYELKGSESEKCGFYLRADSISIQYSDSLIQSMIDSGISSDDIKKRENVENVQVNALEGKDGDCKIVVSDLTALLQLWKTDVEKAGVFSSDEIKSYECTGSYFS